MNALLLPLCGISVTQNTRALTLPANNAGTPNTALSRCRVMAVAEVLDERALLSGDRRSRSRLRCSGWCQCSLYFLVRMI